MWNNLSQCIYSAVVGISSGAVKILPTRSESIARSSEGKGGGVRGILIDM